MLVTAGQSTDSSPLGRSSACGTCCVTAAGSMDLSVYLSYRTDFYSVFKIYQRKTMESYSLFVFMNTSVTSRHMLWNGRGNCDW